MAGALIVAGCDAPAASSPSFDGSPLAAKGPIALPGANSLVPADVAGATKWTRMDSLPNHFDVEMSHPTPGELADAFGAAIHARWAGRPDRPDLNLETVDESADGALLIVSETGVGDDSVAGSQYALTLVRQGDGWKLDELWTRALCRRGVSDEFCV